MYKKPTRSMKAIAAALSYDYRDAREIDPAAVGFTPRTVAAALARMHAEGHVIRNVDTDRISYYLTSVARSEYPQR